MADVTEEHRLGAIELGERLRPLAHMLFGPGARNRRLQVIGDELMKRARLIERSHRVYAGNQHRGEVLAAGV